MTVCRRQGATKVALYGLGSIRDERLGRAFQTPGCVQWQRPAPAPGYPAEEWLNLFVLHQNRVQHGAFAKACVQEQHLPRFLDLVIWGHEHECRWGVAVGFPWLMHLGAAALHSNALSTADNSSVCSQVYNNSMPVCVAV